MMRLYDRFRKEMNMNNKILITTLSKTGFTRKYAEMIAEEIPCTLADFQKTTPETMSSYDTVVFGSRAHAGMFLGYQKAKTMFEKSTAKNFIVFSTGASPNGAAITIAQFWENNLGADDLKKIPHFYMQSGLCYEKMGFGDKAMMKVASIMIGRKKKKTEDEKAFEKAISGSYDISSKEYAVPLIDLLRKMD